MTLDELAASLPCGLHDAELASVTIDYVKREAKLILDIWVPDDRETETYRLAEITLSGLLFWVCEPPDPDYPYDDDGPERLDVGPLDSLRPTGGTLALPPIPPDAFAHWFFVVDWNAFIYVAARDARLIWLGEPAVRT